MKQKILTRLRELEARENIKILYACESGSRAWGFASKDSDYDVRFIYLHPPQWYLSLRKGKDTIVLPIKDELDFHGWDLQKALSLFWRSNPHLLDWLQSPIIYLESYSIIGKLRNLIDQYYAPAAVFNYYRNLALKVYKSYYLKGKMTVKHYFYLLRPILAMQWVENHPGPPPVEFEKLVERVVVQPQLKEAIAQLLIFKKESLEKEPISNLKLIDAFIEQKIQQAERDKLKRKKHRGSLEQLNNLFLTALNEVWNQRI